MAGEAARIRAALPDASPERVAATLLWLVNHCDELSNSNYRIQAGVGLSLLRDVERELGGRSEHQEFRFAPQDLTSGEGTSHAAPDH